jgi:hypothetical protein
MMLKVVKQWFSQEAKADDNGARLAREGMAWQERKLVGVSFAISAFVLF